jgi:hypothetical protein
MKSARAALPNFFVIGAPRSGTTSTYEYLNAHPDVFMSPVKEPDFFSRASLDVAHSPGGTLAASLEVDAQAHAALKEDLAGYLDLFGGAQGEKRRGEASAVYLGHPTAAWHIRGYVPDAKLIAILRDPAERAHSHYVHGKRIYAEHGRKIAIGTENRSVDEEFARAVESAYRDGPPERAISDPEVWVRSGFYFQHLRRWQSLFPPEQLIVFLFEDLVRDPAGFMRRIFEFLAVDDSFALPTTEAFNASVVPRSRGLFSLFTTRNPLMRHARSMAPAWVRALALRTRNRLLGGAKPPIAPDLRRKLVAIYREDVESLQDLLQRDLSAWLAE